MGLLSCFGLRTKSYNAKKYELNADKKDKTKKRVSTDSIGVADTNVHPQLIEETGGGIHPINGNVFNGNKEMNGNDCQSIDKQKNEFNCKEDNRQKDEQNDDEENEPKVKSHQIEEQKHDSTHEMEYQKESIPDKQTIDESDHKLHSTSDHSSSVEDSGNQSHAMNHSTDHNTIPMETSDLSGDVVDSSTKDSI